jgi:hypothetical protein
MRDEPQKKEGNIMSQQFADEHLWEVNQGPESIIPADRPIEGATPIIPQDPPGVHGPSVVPSDAEIAEGQPTREGEQVPGVGQMAGAPHLAGSAQTVNHPEVQIGMPVVGSDGALLGQVRAVHERGILVERHMQRDLVVPFEALHVLGDQALLNVPAEQADAPGWGQSSVM